MVSVGLISCNSEIKLENADMSGKRQPTDWEIFNIEPPSNQDIFIFYMYSFKVNLLFFLSFMHIFTDWKKLLCSFFSVFFLRLDDHID